MVYGIPENYRFILASRSPRRQQLLREAGFEFTVKVIDYDETIPGLDDGKQIAEYLSRSKAGCFRNQKLESNEIVITADTIVWCEGKVLDKPASYEDAVRILRIISGRTHEVITGVSVLTAGTLLTFSETTRVTFEKLSEEEIDFYIRTCKPFDKAGA